MSYNNFDENRPNQNNGILTDIGSINDALNALRNQGLSTNFPTNTTAGMPFARLETRDDNALQNKVVVYRRNADDDDWLKVYDEEYGVDADLYKGNDIDSDGDGKVDSAEEADHALTADSANNADTANSATIADNADKIEGQILGKERFFVSGNVGGFDEYYTLTSESEVLIKSLPVYLNNGQVCKLKRLRFYAGASLDDDAQLKITSDTDTYISGARAREESPDSVILTASSSTLYTIRFWLINQSLSDFSIIPADGFWVDLSIE